MKKIILLLSVSLISLSKNSRAQEDKKMEILEKQVINILKELALQKQK